MSRFEYSERAFAHSGNTTGWKSSDPFSSEIERQCRRVAVPPEDDPIFGQSKNLRTPKTGRGRHPEPIQVVLGTGISALLGVTLVMLILAIHPAPDQLTLQKDKSELARLETQSPADAAHTEARSLTSAKAGSAGIERFDAWPEERLQFEALKSRLITSKGSSVDQKMDADSGATRTLKTLKRDPKGRPNNARNPHRQRTVVPTRQRYEQRGPSSFFAALGHAVGFSSN
jgi:hypothetical protein